MIKWIKRIVIGFLSTILILILLLVIIKPIPYYIINNAVGIKMQWYGYDKEGNEMIEKSIKNSRTLVLYNIIQLLFKTRKMVIITKL